MVNTSITKFLLEPLFDPLLASFNESDKIEQTNHNNIIDV